VIGCGEKAVHVNNACDNIPLGSRGSRQTDGRRFGSFDGHRANPALVSANLAWRVPPWVLGSHAAGASEKRVGARPLERAARHGTSEDRSSGHASSADGRRRFAAAGGPQKVCSRAAPLTRRSEAITVKSRVT